MSKRILVLDYDTNKELGYDQIYLHGEPETDLVSLYNGGFGDAFRTIYKIKSKQNDYLTGNLTIQVRKF